MEEIKEKYSIDETRGWMRLTIFNLKLQNYLPYPRRKRVASLLKASEALQKTASPY